MIVALITIISIGIFITILLVMNNNKESFDKYENEPDNVCLLRKHLNDERDIVERVIEVQNKFPNEKIIDTINAHYLLFRRLYNDIDRCGGVQKIDDATISYEYWWDVRYDDDKLYIYDNTNYFIYIIYFLIKKIVAFNNIPKPIKDFECVQIYDETIPIEYNTYHRFEEKKTIYTNGKYKSFYIYNPNL